MTEFTQADLDATLAKFAPGTSWHCRILCGSRRGNRVHISGVVDGDQIVFKWWRYRRNRWQYQVESAWDFWWLDEHGEIEP